MNNKLSVAVLTFNEEKNVWRTFESVKDIAYEIVVVDSGSTDKTLEIAAKYNCKVFSEDWKGFVEQRNSVVEKCTGDWILILDADEELTPEMARNIAQELENPKFDAYRIPRKVHYLGKTLNNSWQPDSIVRLLHRKTKPHYTGTLIHEQLNYTGTTGEIGGFAIHYSYKILQHHYEKMVSYAKVAVRVVLFHAANALVS